MCNTPLERLCGAQLALAHERSGTLPYTFRAVRTCPTASQNDSMSRSSATVPRRRSRCATRHSRRHSSPRHAPSDSSHEGPPRPGSSRSAVSSSRFRLGGSQPALSCWMQPSISRVVKQGSELIGASRSAPPLAARRSAARRLRMGEAASRSAQWLFADSRRASAAVSRHTASRRPKCGQCLRARPARKCAWVACVHAKLNKPLPAFTWKRRPSAPASPQRGTCERLHAAPQWRARRDVVQAGCHVCAACVVVWAAQHKLPCCTAHQAPQIIAGSAQRVARAAIRGSDDASEQAWRQRQRGARSTCCTEVLNFARGRGTRAPRSRATAPK